MPCRIIRRLSSQRRFSIEVLVALAEGSRLGRIVIGDFSERFALAPAPPVPTVEGLPAAWRLGLARLLTAEDATAVLRTDPMQAWVLYREGSVVHIQQHLLVPGWEGELDAKGSVVRPPPRETLTEDGDPISEWRTSIDAIRAFLDETRG